jgi:hypothetical protein
MEINLSEWTKENEVWKIESWKKFVEKYIVPLQRMGKKYQSIINFLSQFSGKLLESIEDKEIRERIEVAVASTDEKFSEFIKKYFGIYIDREAYSKGLSSILFVETPSLYYLINFIFRNLELTRIKELEVKAEEGIDGKSLFLELFPKLGENEKANKLNDFIEEVKEAIFNLLPNANEYTAFLLSLMCNLNFNLINLYPWLKKEKSELFQFSAKTLRGEEVRDVDIFQSETPLVCKFSSPNEISISKGTRNVELSNLIPIIFAVWENEEFQVYREEWKRFVVENLRKMLKDKNQEKTFISSRVRPGCEIYEEQIRVYSKYDSRYGRQQCKLYVEKNMAVECIKISPEEVPPSILSILFFPANYGLLLETESREGLHFHFPRGLWSEVLKR